MLIAENIAKNLQDEPVIAIHGPPCIENSGNNYGISQGKGFEQELDQKGLQDEPVKTVGRFGRPPIE